MSEAPSLLDALLRAPGPSGHEAPASAVWRQAASFASLSSDGLGSSVAAIGDEDARPLLAVVGHIDEIGLVITHVDEKGFLYFAPIGGWDPQILVGQRVELQGIDGPVAGVVGRKPIHLLEEEQRKKVVELKSMHIDIGAADREQALALVRIGDPVVIAGEPVRLAGSRLISRSMDNRLGAYVSLEALRRCNERRLGRRADGGGRRRAGGDRALRRPHLGLRGPSRPRDRRRRHPRHRCSRCRGEGDRQPPARLRAGDRPRLDALAEGLRAAARGRRRRRASSTRSRPAATRPAPTPTRSRSRAPASRPAWSRSRCATCTRRWRWSTWPTSRRRWS